MKPLREQLYASNPFATRYVEPGAIPFLFPSGVTAASLIERLRQHHWRGAIVGPHGSGKSTLLAALISELTRQGIPCELTRLHDGERSLPHAAGTFREPCLQIIDGYEQLGWLSRWRLVLDCRRYGTGLLVTSHRPNRLPVLFETAPTLETTQAIVASLLRPGASTITPDDVAAAYSRANGNIRETLFDLYDRYDRLPIGQPMAVRTRT
jgi:GTPase SAR1 family protein